MIEEEEEHCVVVYHCSKVNLARPRGKSNQLIAPQAVEYNSVGVTETGQVVIHEEHVQVGIDSVFTTMHHNLPLKKGEMEMLRGKGLSGSGWLTCGIPVIMHLHLWTS